MKTIVIDPGHGGSDPGATNGSYLEKDFNLMIALKVENYLLQNYEVNIIMTRSSDTKISLTARTQLANSSNADFFLSIHHNAAGGNGFESYIFNGSVPSTTKNYQNVVHDRILKSVESSYNVNDRGKKRANFHVLRESNMAALLLEILFVDHPDDLALLTNPSFINDVSIAIAEGVQEALDLPAKSTPGIVYKVIAGSFRNQENAKERLQYLTHQGINAFIVSTTISGTQYYRVQAGAFSKKENAEQQVEKLKQIGISDTFLITDGEMPSPPPPSPEEGFTIRGDIYLNACQLNDFAKNVNPNALDVGDYYIKYGNLYGIRGDVAFAQAIHETDYFRFTGVVNESQNNYAGLGATGGSEQGASFDTPEEGVHAHIQHLYAYATQADIPSNESIVDPRFDLVQRGSAITWAQLNGKWAVPGNTYGQQILSIFKQNMNHSLEELEMQEESITRLLQEL